jgi:membrane protein
MGARWQSWPPRFRKRTILPQRVKDLAYLAFVGSGAILLSSFKNARRRREVEVASPGAKGVSASPRLPWWDVWRDAAAGWVSHKAASLGAALAYYSMFSLGPLLVVAIAVAGLVFEEDATRGAVSIQLAGLLGPEAARGIEAMLAGAGRPAEGVFATVLSVFTLLFGAVGVVIQLKDALNVVFGAAKQPVRGVWGFIRSYVVSLAGVVAAGFLLLVSLLVSTILAAAGTVMAGYLSEIMLQAASTAISFLVTTGLFAAIYRWLPDNQMRWRDSLPGALLAAALFNVGRLLISLYIGQQGFSSTYGAAASLVIVLIWVYYSSQIVLFGAEFIRAHASFRPSDTGPDARRA